MGTAAIVVIVIANVLSCAFAGLGYLKLRATLLEVRKLSRALERREKDVDSARDITSRRLEELLSFGTPLGRR